MKHYIILVVAILAITGCSEKKQAKIYSLNAKEQSVFDALMKDEVNIFNSGEETVLFDEIPIVRVEDVVKAYNENEIGADQKYLKKTFLLKGQIDSINSGVGNEPYLVMRSSEIILKPRVRFEEGNIEKISNLKKGADINLICDGAGILLKSVQFNNCKFTEDFAVKKISKINSDMDDFFVGKKMDDKKTKTFVISSIALTKLIPEKSPCFTDTTKCIPEIGKVFIDKEKFTKQREQVATELKALGLQIEDDLFKK